MPELLDSWARWAEGPPDAQQFQLLQADRASVGALNRRPGIIHWNSWQEAAVNFLPWDVNCTRLHLGLIPLPFIGNVLKASVYFLLLNPGVSATDYHAEYEIPGFRRRLLSNLRQDFADERFSFLPLDPEFAWHSGAAYWEKKLKHVATQLCERTGAPQAVVRETIAQHVCAIELLPYHSRSFGLSHGACEAVPSAQLARTFVHHLKSADSADEKLFVVMRRERGWGLDHKASNVVVFTPGQARGAHLSTADPGAPGSRVVTQLLPHLQLKLLAQRGLKRQACQ